MFALFFWRLPCCSKSRKKSKNANEAPKSTRHSSQEPPKTKAFSKFAPKNRIKCGASFCTSSSRLWRGESEHIKGEKCSSRTNPSLICALSPLYTPTRVVRLSSPLPPAPPPAEKKTKISGATNQATTKFCQKRDILLARRRKKLPARDNQPVQPSLAPTMKIQTSISSRTEIDMAACSLEDLPVEIVCKMAAMLGEDRETRHERIRHNFPPKESKNLLLPPPSASFAFHKSTIELFHRDACFASPRGHTWTQ